MKDRWGTDLTPLKKIVIRPSYGTILGVSVMKPILEHMSLFSSSNSIKYFTI